MRTLPWFAAMMLVAALAGCARYPDNGTYYERGFSGGKALHVYSPWLSCDAGGPNCRDGRNGPPPWSSYWR